MIEFEDIFRFLLRPQLLADFLLYLALIGYGLSVTSVTTVSQEIINLSARITQHEFSET